MRQKALNPLRTARIKYIDLRYKWIIDRVKNGYFRIYHMALEDIAADRLTKPLEKIKH